ncbi:MAG TPA: protein kinase [Chitinispirillaceae bacterium]|nr:protein kinase [Chitinispirillaceae bacterium]
MSSSEYEIVNCLLSNENHRLLVVKSRNGNEQYLMKSCDFNDSSFELGKRNRYKRELEFISTFDHPNIFKPLSSEDIDTSVSIIYPYRKGTTLQRFFAAKITLSIAEKLKMVIQLVEAIEHIHSRGIVHGDLHPGNIFVREDRGVEIYDLSMCMTEEEFSRRQDGLMVGTYPYLSPEQTGFTRFKVDTRSDLYCVGIILYQLLSNRFPFTTQNGTIEELLDFMLKTELEPIRNVPYYINEILLKALRTTPEERYQTAIGLKYDLKTALSIIQNESLAQELVPGEKDAIFAVSRFHFFIAREKEIEILNKGLAALMQKESSSFLLSGVAGIGKSEIIRKFLSNQQIDSVYVVSARCNRFTPNQPYSTIRSLMLEFLTKIQDKDSRDKVLLRKNLNTIFSDYSAVICSVIPELKGYFDSVNTSEQLEKESGAERICHILISILDMICTSFPIILVIDDLQWIDSLSFDFLMRFKKSESPKMMIFACKTEGKSGKPIFRYSIAEIADKLMIIQPLSRNEMVWLVYSIFDQVKNEEILIEVLEHKCNGNPFMLIQMLRYLLDSSIIRKVKENWVFIPELISEIPGNLDSVSLIKHKLSNLSERELHFLKIGSLMGGRLELQILEEIGAFDESQSKIILKKLESEGLLVTNFKGEVRFSHDKIQEVLLTCIPDQEKACICEALAVEYEALSNTKVEYLFDAAETYRKTSKFEKAVDLSLKAAQYAVDKAAYDLATNYYSNALNLIDKLCTDDKSINANRRNIELALAEALMLNGKYEQALLIYNNHSAGNGDNPIENSEILFKVGCIHLNIGEYLQAQDCFRRALAMLGIPFCTNKSRFPLNTFLQILFHLILQSPLRLFIPRSDNQRRRLGIKILNKYSYALSFTDINSCFYPHFLALNLSAITGKCMEKTETELQHAVISYQIHIKSRASDKIDKLIKHIKKAGWKNLVAGTSAIHGILHYYSARWKESEDTLLESISEFKANGDNINQLLCLEHLWKTHYLKGDLNRAMKYITHAISLVNYTHDTLESKTFLAARNLLECQMDTKADMQKESKSQLISDSNTPFFIMSRIKILRLEYELLKENYSQAWHLSSELLSIYKSVWFNYEYAVPVFSLSCELAVRDILNSKDKCTTNKGRKKAISTLRHSLFMLILSSWHYRAYRCEAYRFLGWYLSLVYKRNGLASYFIKKSIAYSHRFQMKIDEARAYRDLGLFNEKCNLPGIATDHFDEAFRIFRQCGALLEAQKILDKITPQNRKKFLEDTTRISLNQAENSNQIRFDTLLQISSSISAITDFSVLLNQILSGMIKATGAQYGCIFVKGQDNVLKCMLKLDFQGKILKDGAIVISMEIVTRAEESRQVVLISDGEQYIRDGKETERIRSVLCVPIYREDDFLGCVYLGNDKVAGLFSESAVKTAQILSAHAGILFENAYLMEKYKQLNRDLDNKVKQQTHDMMEKNRQLEQANIKLVESERVKGVLSGTLVHDIKNYAAGIEGNLQYLGRKFEQDDKVKRVLDVVSETCSDIVSLASNLLDIAKMDEGKLVVRAEHLDVNYISSLADKFSVNTLFDEKEIHPVIIPSQEKFSIYADVYLLERVMQNLFSNAAKYVPRKGKVEMSFHADEKENLICFFNSGIAIPEKEREVLFEKYARIENHHSQYSKGLGLFFLQNGYECSQRADLGGNRSIR